MALDLKGETSLVNEGRSDICLELIKKSLADDCNVAVADLPLRIEDQGVLEKGGAKAKAALGKTKMRRLVVEIIQATGHYVAGAEVFESCNCGWHQIGTWKFSLGVGFGCN